MEKHITSDGRWAIIGQDYYDPKFAIVELTTGYITHGYHGGRIIEGAPCLDDYNANQTFAEKWLTRAGTAMFECYGDDMDKEWCFVKSILGDIDLRYWEAVWVDETIRHAYNQAHDTIIALLSSIPFIKDDEWFSRGAKTGRMSPIWKNFGRWDGNQNMMPATGFVISIKKPWADIYVDPKPRLKTKNKEFNLRFTHKNVLVEDKESELSYSHIMTLQDFLATL